MKPHLQLRKSIVLLLIGCMFLSSSAFADAEGDYTYTVTDGKTTTTAYTGSGEDISIPPTLGGYPTVAAGADPTIGLWDPEYSECGWVTINGGVSGTLGPPFWDWGDGTTTTSYFAAYHRYLSNGTYTVLVTAEFCSSASASKIVNITNAEDPGCPSESDSSCRYLFPYNLHLVAGQTTATPLQFRDQSGNLVTGVTAFDPGDATLVSISEDGYVTALRTETSTEIGAWMHAKLDGKWAANSCVVRVLPTDYALAFSEIVGEHTVLYYPSSIEGEDLDALVDLYQMPTVNDYAYEIQSDLMGVQPSGGCRQIIEVDLGVSETNRVCGMAGNPIRIGWNIEGGQNCFLLFPRSPQWGVIFHEMGHSFLGESPSFARALDTFYSEGMATAVSIADLACILGDERSYPIEDLTRTSLLDIYSFDRTLYLARRQEWLDGALISLT